MLQFLTTNIERRVEKRLTLLVGLIERGFAWSFKNFTFELGKENSEYLNWVEWG